MSQGPEFNPTTPQYPDHGAAGWGPGGPGGGYRADHPDAVVIFVLGLVSLLMLPPLGFLPWIMGNRARREIRRSPGVYRNEGLVTAGWILGIVAAVLTLLFVLFIAGMMIFGLALPLFLVGAG
ncbi:DUF4190 domain-containing protein [Kytococcus sp. Marseille-QA3725]